MDVHARGFWDRQGSAFFDVRVFHPNTESYKDLTIQQLYRKHEDEKKRLYANRVLEVEQGTFTPLVFTTTGGMAVGCKRFHSRLAELIAIKKGEEYSTTMSWIRSTFIFFLRTFYFIFCFCGPFSIALLRTKVYHLFYLFVGKQNNVILHFLPEISPQSVLTACISYFLRELCFIF